MKMVTLGDIFTYKEGEDLVDIINSTPDEIKRRAKLRNRLGKISKKLLKKGVDPDYMVLYLEFLRVQVINQKKMDALSNN